MLKDINVSFSLHDDGQFLGRKSNRCGYHYDHLGVPFCLLDRFLAEGYENFESPPLFFFFFFSPLLFRATLLAYESSQARNRNRTTAAGHSHSHSNVGS